jgi:hypothetical protein
LTSIVPITKQGSADVASLTLVSEEVSERKIRARAKVILVGFYIQLS